MIELGCGHPAISLDGRSAVGGCTAGAAM